MDEWRTRRRGQWLEFNCECLEMGTRNKGFA